MRTIGRSPETKPIPASSTVIFSQNELANEGVVAFVISMVGNGGVVASTGLERVRVKAGGKMIQEWEAVALRSYNETFSSTHHGFGTSDTDVIIPFGLFEAPTEAAQDRAQFPSGLAATLELEFGSAGDGTGGVEVGWIQTNQKAEAFVAVSSSALNWAANTSNQVHTIRQRGRFRGMCLNRDGLDDLRVELNGRQVVNTAGNGLSSTIDLMSASQRLSGINSGNDCIWLPYGKGTAIGDGAGSFVQGDTTSDWGGTGNTLTVATLHPQ